MSVQGLQNAWDALAADAEAIAGLRFSASERRGCVLPLPQPAASSAVDWSAIAVWIIDPDNVLHDSTHWRRWLVQLLCRMGIKTRYRTFWAVWEEGFLEPVQRGERSFDDAFRAFLLSLELTRGQADEVVAAALSKRRRLDQDARPLPGATATLARLRENGSRVCVLSSAESSSIDVESRIASLGLRRHVDRVATSCDWKTTLDDSSCYLHALAPFGVEPESAGFVSGNVDRIAAAAKCGLRTVAVYPDRLPPRADAVLSRLEEIVSLWCSQTPAPPVIEAAT